MGGDDAQEVIAIMLQLVGAHPVDFGKGLPGGGPAPHHLPQGTVAEDHVGRHPRLFRQGTAQILEGLPQGLVSGTQLRGRGL